MLNKKTIIELMCENINEIGAWASIIGGLIGLATLFFAYFINNEVKSTKKKVMFNTRVVPLLKELKRNSLELKNLYKDYDNKKNEIKDMIAKSRVQLESIVNKIPNEYKKDFKNQIQHLKKAQKSKIDNRPIEYKDKFYKRNVIFTQKQDVWDIYVELNYCANKLDNLIKDKKII